MIRLNPDGLLSFVTLLICLMVAQKCVNSANILFFHNLSTYSHRIVSYPLAVALQEKGHQVTFITPYKWRESAHPNITDIVPASFEKSNKKFVSDDFDIHLRINQEMQPLVNNLFPGATTTCETLLSSPEFQTYLEETTQLDLVIVDNCMTECITGVVYKYQAKLVYLSTLPHFGYEFDFFGFTPESSAIPELETYSYQVPMKFLERVQNTLSSIHFRYRQYIYLQEIDRLIRSHMSLSTESMPFVDDIARNVSLVLYTGDFVGDYPRSQPPFVVNVAGIHLRNGSGKLPDDIALFLNSTVSEGFVYISLGSLAVSSDLPDEIQQVFFDTIKSFPQLKFLWKWNGKLPNKLSSNVFFANWFPQIDVLAHPDIKAFLTQGGRPSSTESLYYKVPMITFPVLGDQDFNSKRMNQMGGNVLLELGTVTRKQLKDALHKVVYDPVMKERMENLQKIFVDRPIMPLPNAVWWMEYVLRHPNTSHLRPATFDQTWYQRRLLDVWAFVFTIISCGFVLGIFILTFVFKTLYKYFVQSSVAFYPKIKAKTT